MGEGGDEGTVSNASTLTPSSPMAELNSLRNLPGSVLGNRRTSSMADASSGDTLALSPAGTTVVVIVSRSIASITGDFRAALEMTSLSTGLPARRATHEAGAD